MRPALRNVTIADMQAQKGKRKWTQVTCNSQEEALAAHEVDLDMIICNSANVEAVSSAYTPQFLTAVIGLPDSIRSWSCLNGTPPDPFRIRCGPAPCSPVSGAAPGNNLPGPGADADPLP